MVLGYQPEINSKRAHATSLRCRLAAFASQQAASQTDPKLRQHFLIITALADTQLRAIRSPRQPIKKAGPASRTGPAPSSMTIAWPYRLGCLRRAHGRDQAWPAKCHNSPIVRANLCGGITCRVFARVAPAIGLRDDGPEPRAQRVERRMLSNPETAPARCAAPTRDKQEPHSKTSAA